MNNEVEAGHFVEMLNIRFIVHTLDEALNAFTFGFFVGFMQNSVGEKS